MLLSGSSGSVPVEALYESGSYLTHTFSSLGQGDAGLYTCEATITTDLLLLSPLTQSDVLDITVASKSVSVCVCIKYKYEVSSFKQ